MMSKFIEKSDVKIALKSIAGFAHEWVKTANNTYDFNREAIKEECECGCEECGCFPLAQLADDEILLSPGAIYRVRKEEN
ncbi:hypothetical protein L9W80_16925 [Vibrio aestuarianus]|uniref:hypothetical protein n=1 Tax=Vibrio aestuarianus TaxID=28171 RepID=UPI00237CE1FA|nr:hypothetical protein [Vibrio aestuarianus]MDE1351831.1 hypothetical protein [Vibrio aestuarianus]